MKGKIDKKTDANFDSEKTKNSIKKKFYLFSCNFKQAGWEYLCNAILFRLRACKLYNSKICCEKCGALRKGART